MTKYISGKELLTHLGIQPFELFNYVKKEEYKPLDQFGRPIPPPDISAKLKNLEELQKELDRIPKPQWVSLEEMKKYGSHPPSWVFGVFEEQERAKPRRENLSRKIDSLKEEMKNVTDINSWANYELPKDSNSAQWVISQLEKALFEIGQEKAQGQGEELVKEKPVEIAPKPLDVDAYIKKRRAEGIHDDALAFELYDKQGNYKLSYLKIARSLGLNNNLQSGQVDAMKQRARRACGKGKKLSKKGKVVTV